MRGITGKNSNGDKRNPNLTSPLASAATIFASRLSFLCLSHFACRFKKLKSVAFSPTVLSSLSSTGRHCGNDDSVVGIVFTFSIVEQDALLADERILLPNALFPPVGPERANTI